MKLFAGTGAERLPGKKYAGALPFVELQLRAPLPRISKLKTWRESMPEGLKVSLVVPQGCFVSEDKVVFDPACSDEHLEWLREAITVLKADFALLVTPRSFGPGVRDRARMEEFLKRAELNELTQLAWSAGGMWEQESAERFAEKLSVVPTIDAIEYDGWLPQKKIYARHKAMGLRKRFGEGILYELAENLLRNPSDECFVTFSSERSFDEAKKFLEIMSDLSSF